MSKKPPTLGQTLVMTGFVISCFGILLFLWISFQGPIPLGAQPYTFKARFDEATQLAQGVDVRISGVTVGKVQSVELDEESGLAETTLAIDDTDVAPVPADTRAVLRLRTLLGETYVELSLGDRDGPTLAEGSTLAQGQVEDTVQLDEVLRAFDPRTRSAMRTWMADSSEAVEGGAARSLNSSIGLLPPFFAGFDEVFRTLDRQERAVRVLFSDGARTFDALSRRRGALRGAIEGANAVFRTTAERDRDLVATFEAFPTFLDESRATLARLRGFSRETDPLVIQLTPAARQLSGTFEELGRLAPQAQGLFGGLRPVINRADKAFPALRRFLRGKFPKLLRDLDPFLSEVNPILAVIQDYERELTALLGNAATATNTLQTGGPHYLRTLPTLSPESVAAYPRRLRSNRNTAYTTPGGYNRLAEGLLNFDTRQCSGGILGSLDPGSPGDPAFNVRTEGNVGEAQDFFDRLEEFAFGGRSDTNVPAPGCGKQSPFEPFGATGAATDYPHTLEQP